MLVLGLLFIYLPMLILVIYSFNASKLVTVWGGWSSSGTSACSTTPS
jgi:putrescine transport system permease protein